MEKVHLRLVARDMMHLSAEQILDSVIGCHFCFMEEKTRQAHMTTEAELPICNTQGWKKHFTYQLRVCSAKFEKIRQEKEYFLLIDLKVQETFKIYSKGTNRKKPTHNTEPPRKERLQPEAIRACGIMHRSFRLCARISSIR